MSDLVSMELSASDAKAFGEAVPSKPEPPKYPYGLQLNLDEAALAKLGIEKLPEVGSKMVLEAVVEVTSAGIHEDQGGKRRHINLQVTDMDLQEGGEDEEEEKSAADKIYDRHGNPGTTKEKPGTVIMEDM